jgi:hypothetical protein
MPMMTGEEYRASIIDGRRCYIDGELIKARARVAAGIE